MKGTAKMSQEELARRKKATIRNARAELVKSGIVQFRIEPERLQQLYDLADARKLRVGAMVREWVNERMDAEQQGLPRRSKKSRLPTATPTDRFVQRLAQLEKHVRILNEKIEESNQNSAKHS